MFKHGFILICLLSTPVDVDKMHSRGANGANGTGIAALGDAVAHFPCPIHESSRVPALLPAPAPRPRLRPISATHTDPLVST